MSANTPQLAVDNMSKLIATVPGSPILFVALAVLVPLMVRVGISWVEAKRLQIQNGFWLIFRGVGGNKENEQAIPADYWLAFVLGFGEMLAYPLLIVTNQPLFIGFWLGLKTAHRWSYAPNYLRGPYNRYVVANAVILISAYFSARWTVVN